MTSLLTSVGVIIGTKPAAIALFIASESSAHLEAGADALEEVEPGAGHLGPALHVDRVEALGQRQVVARLDALGGEVAGRADRLDDDVVVLAAHRHLGLDDVADGAQQGVELGLRLVGGRLQGLDLGRDLLGARQQRLLLVALGPRDVLAHRLLLGPQPLVRGEGAAAALVGGADGVDDALVLTPRPLAGAHEVGVVPEQLDVDHPASLSARSTLPVQTPIAGGPVQDLVAGRAAVVTGGARGIGLARRRGDRGPRRRGAGCRRAGGRARAGVVRGQLRRGRRAGRVGGGRHAAEWSRVLDVDLDG